MKRPLLRQILLYAVALAVCAPVHLALSEWIDDVMIAPTEPPTFDALRTYFREGLDLTPRLLLACGFSLGAVALLSRFSRWWAAHRVFAVTAAWGAAGVLYFFSERLLDDPFWRALTWYDLRSASSLLLGGVLTGFVFYFMAHRRRGNAGE